jgi:hypothetical protein
VSSIFHALTMILFPIISYINPFKFFVAKYSKEAFTSVTHVSGFDYASPEMPSGVWEKNSSFLRPIVSQLNPAQVSTWSQRHKTFFFLSHWTLRWNKLECLPLPSLFILVWYWRIRLGAFPKVEHLTSPHLTSPHLTSPHLTSPQHFIFFVICEWA